MVKIRHIIIIAALAGACTNLSDLSRSINLEGHTMVEVDTEEIAIFGDSFSDAWTSGDRIGVFGDEEGYNVAYTLRRSDDGLDTGHFYGPLVKGGLTAYYPYNANASISEGFIPFDLASVQKFDESASAEDAFLDCSKVTFASMESDGKMHFRYPLGIIAVVFDFDESLNIVNMSLGSDMPLSGRLFSDGLCNVKGSALSSRSVSLDFGGNVVASRKDGQCMPFYFVVPPAVYPAKSLVLDVVTADESMRIALGGLDVRRVDGTDFTVTTVKVGATDIPGFIVDDGFLE